VARERTKVILLTLSGSWSVRDGYERLGVKRTRFQALRRRLLEAAVGAMEGGSAGRPPTRQPPEDERVRQLGMRIEDLEHELRVAETRLELAQGGAGEAVRRRVARRTMQRRTR
jgi:hypothetical protein